jgi:hypothetical protein
MSQCSAAMQFAARRDGRVEKYFAAREACGGSARRSDSNDFTQTSSTRLAVDKQGAQVPDAHGE